MFETKFKLVDFSPHGKLQSSFAAISLEILLTSSMDSHYDC